MTLPDKKTLALKTLSVMAGFADAGTSRQSDPAQIGRFCDLFDIPHSSPFCAVGLFYSMCKAFADLTGLDTSMEELKEIKKDLAAHYLTPSPSCGAILSDAKVRGIWVPKWDIEVVQPGWLSLFNWHGGTAPEHVGIVETLTDDILHDVEMNTSSASNANGGTCARRVRTEACLLGVVAVYR